MFADTMTQSDLLRLLFYQGQLFASADFREFEAQEDRLRHLHTATLHDAYGILEGLQVQIKSEGDKIWAEVSSGVAVDAWGREICLSRNQTTSPLSDVTKSWVLVLRRKVRKNEIQSDRFELPFCDVTTVDSAELCWLPENEIDVGYDIPLTGWNGAEEKEDRKLRRPLKPLRRPKIGYGSLDISINDMQPWSEKLPDEIASALSSEDLSLGAQYLVDTAPAGFQRTPNYLANVKWKLVYSSGQTIIWPTFFATLVDSIAEPTAKNFLLRFSIACLVEKKEEQTSTTLGMVARKTPGRIVNSGVAAFLNLTKKKKTVMASFIQAGRRAAKIPKLTMKQLAGIYFTPVRQAVVMQQKEEDEENELVDLRLLGTWIGIE